MNVESPVPPPDFILGLDLGRSQDFTALAVLERLWVRTPEDPRRMINHYALRHLKRWPLKTSYPDIVAEVAQLVQTPQLCKNGDFAQPLLAVDQTGVGVAIVDMFRKTAVKASLNPIVITAGHEIKHEWDWHVPKKELVSTIQLLLQTKRIKFARMPERNLLVQELLNFKVKITISANETYEAWREKDHDDMVLAVALAAWLGERRGPRYDAPPVYDVKPRRLTAAERLFGARGP